MIDNSSKRLGKKIKRGLISFLGLFGKDNFFGPLLFSLILLIFLSVTVSLVLNRTFSQKSKATEEALTKTNRKDQLIVVYDFEKPKIEKSHILEGYYQVTINDVPNYGQPGYPNLPLRGAKILVPYGKKIDSVTYKSSSKEYLGSYKIEPAQKPYPLLSEKNLKKFGFEDSQLTLPDNGIYFQKSSYPAKKIEDKFAIQRMHGYDIGIFSLNPIEYIPQTGELYFTKQITVIVNLTNNVPEREIENLQPRNFPEDINDVQKYVDNKEMVDSYSKGIKKVMVKKEKLRFSKVLPNNSAASYIVITKSEFVGDENSGFNRLIKDKERSGISAAIVTVDGPAGIYAIYSGYDNQEKIRNFIKDAYINRETRYILLGGDGDAQTVGGESEESIIPTRLLDDPTGSLERYQNGVASDNYYANLDGDFDYNGNHDYGEINVDRVDLLAEVSVGRIPADSMSEVNNYIDKYIQYKYFSVPSVTKRVYMAGEYLGAGGGVSPIY